MTTYFDAASERARALLAKVRAADDGYDDEAQKAIIALEQEVVRDVTVCAEWPSFPVGIKHAIHATILKYASNSQPRNCVPQCPEYEDLAAHIRGIDDMCSRLHSCFHDLGHLRLDNFTDDPRFPLWCLFGVGEDSREALAEPSLRAWKRQIADYDEADRADAHVRVGQRAYNYARLNGATPEQAEAKRAEALATLQGKE